MRHRRAAAKVGHSFEVPHFVEKQHLELYQAVTNSSLLTVLIVCRIRETIW